MRSTLFSFITWIPRCRGGVGPRRHGSRRCCVSTASVWRPNRKKTPRCRRRDWSRLGASSESQEQVFASFDAIRTFTNTRTFRGIEGEPEVAAHLSATDAPTAAAHAPATAEHIDERLKSIEHDLSRHDNDLRACIEELESLLGDAVHIIRRIVRNGRIPDHVPRCGRFPLSAGARDSRRQVSHRSGKRRPGAARSSRRASSRPRSRPWR